MQEGKESFEMVRVLCQKEGQRGKGGYRINSFKTGNVGRSQGHIGGMGSIKARL